MVSQQPFRGLVTIGESLALLTTREPEQLWGARELELRVGGAESNVAIGVRRLGQPATWIGRVGDDALGTLVTRTLRAEDVHVAAIADTAPTSLMVKDRGGPAPRISYYRGQGPGARLRPGDLDAALIERAGVLHLTGITAALSDDARATLRAAIEIARTAGVTVSFDVNHRAKLWPAAVASRELRALVALADHVFVGDDEARALGWEREPAALGAALLALGPAQVVVKLGAAGALAVGRDGALPVAPVPVDAIDPVGAGDAFAAGYLAELLAGRPLMQRLRTAAACGAAACASRGDWEALPTRADLARSDRPGEVVR